MFKKQPTIFHQFSVFSTYSFCFWKAVFLWKHDKIVLSEKHSFSKKQLVKPTFFTHVKKKHLIPKKHSFAWPPLKNPIFTGFFGFFHFHFFFFLFLFFQHEKRPKQKMQFSFREPHFWHPPNFAKTLFWHSVTLLVFSKIPKNTAKWGKQWKKLGPVFNTRLGPVFNARNPKSWTSF